jgi:hypothetical protein
MNVLHCVRVGNRRPIPLRHAIRRTGTVLGSKKENLTFGGPLRENTRTRSPSRRHMNRNPSCLISWAHCGPSGAIREGRQAGRHKAGWIGWVEHRKAV